MVVAVNIGVDALVDISLTLSKTLSLLALLTGMARQISVFGVFRLSGSVG